MNPIKIFGKREHVLFQSEDSKNFWNEKGARAPFLGSDRLCIDIQHITLEVWNFHI